MKLHSSPNSFFDHRVKVQAIETGLFVDRVAHGKQAITAFPRQVPGAMV
jgi:hypothetical protein